ncbi:hypothetical protein RchiOBHm_Chr1g0328921 [Rosa chinensis]|uniref:Uncharacterized protein n=1 Tax=Rosa chinensis TaxID=74649 RepID=A0A2P6SAW8_ROSCH|nr:hypothetical protein RchiOBHm_Chr1g0328921 [Rosa chinensis]
MCHCFGCLFLTRCPIASFDLDRQVSHKLLFPWNLSHSLIKGSRIHKTYRLKAGFWESIKSGFQSACLCTIQPLALFALI